MDLLQMKLYESPGPILRSNYNSGIGPGFENCSELYLGSIRKVEEACDPGGCTSAFFYQINGLYPLMAGFLSVSESSPETRLLDLDPLSVALLSVSKSSPEIKQ